MNIELQYLNLLEKIVTEGTVKRNRTGVDTLVLPPQVLQHDMREGFPLLTTKRLPPKTIFTELEGFIGGITDKRWYQERGCHLWDEWSNPDGEEHDLGPIYGYQWRRFNEWDGCEPLIISKKILPEYRDAIDQLASIVRTLKTNPDDRRMVCSAWNPEQIAQMALPPCHYSWSVQHIEGVLHLSWEQRSCDMFLGVPFNIASYAMLLELLAKESDMEAGTLTGTLKDCHIYTNHLEQVKKQLDRVPRDLPTIDFSYFTNIWEWEATDVTISDYKPWPQIKGAVAV